MRTAQVALPWRPTAPVLTLVTLVLALAVLGRRSPVAWLIAAALVVYVIGGFGVTMTRSVPLNEHLADVATVPGPALSAERSSYESDWNTWNTVRTLASLGAFALLAAAAVLPSRHEMT